MMFSKSCEYAIKAVIHLCIETKGGKKLGISEIAQAIDTPEAFTGKILQILVRHKIISSSKAPGGGFFIEPEAKPLIVMDIVDLIEVKGHLNAADWA